MVNSCRLTVFCDTAQEINGAEVIKVPSSSKEICQVRNSLITSCKSEYICFLKSGINNINSRFDAQINFLDENKSYGAIGSDVAILNDGEVTSIIEYPEKFEDCYGLFYEKKEEFIFPSAAVLRRKSVLDIGGYSSFIRNSEEKIKYAVDLSLFCRMMSFGIEVGNIKIPLISTVIENTEEPPEYSSEKLAIWGMFRRKTFSKPVINNYSEELFGAF